MTNTRKFANLPYNSKLKARARELRRSGNLSEVLLWQQIKNKNLLGLDFDRQRIIGNYIVDFFCKDLGVIIEIDGLTHDFKVEYDKKRDEYFGGLGLPVIHILDIDVKKDLASVFSFLECEIAKFMDKATPSVRSLRQLTSTPSKKGN